MPRGENEVDAIVEGFLKSQGVKADQIPKALLSMIRGMFTNQPYIEGAWMTKHEGTCTGAEYNVYAGGVYVSDHPLGHFAIAGNNPYSYKPGGFLQEQDTAPRWRTGAECPSRDQEEAPRLSGRQELYGH